MGDWIQALANLGAPTWVTVGVIVIAGLCYAMAPLIKAWRGRPAVAGISVEFADSLRRLNEGQGRFFDRMERTIDRLEREAAAAHQKAKSAEVAVADCEQRHEECKEETALLKERVDSLESYVNGGG